MALCNILVLSLWLLAASSTIDDLSAERRQLAMVGAPPPVPHTPIEVPPPVPHTPIEVPPPVPHTPVEVPPPAPAPAPIVNDVASKPVAPWKQNFPTLREKFMDALKKVKDEVKEKLKELLEELLEEFLNLLLGGGSGSSSDGSNLNQKSTSTSTANALPSNGCVNAQRSALNAPPDVSVCTTFSSYDLLGRTPPNATQKDTLCDPKCFSLLDRLVSMAIPDCGRGFDDKAVDRAVDQLEWFEACPAIVSTVTPGLEKVAATARPSVVVSDACDSWLSIQTAMLMITTVVAVAVVA